MLFIPFPFVLAEIVIFVVAVQRLGFLNTLGLYLLPCLLGIFILSVVGRVAILSFQASLMKGQLPAGKILHSGAIFLSGLLFLIPSFFTRIVALVLLLPGLRHLAVWRFKKQMGKRMKQGMGGGFAEFKYYDFRQGGASYQEAPPEREVREAQVLDVTPLEIKHEDKKREPEEP